MAISTAAITWNTDLRRGFAGSLNASNVAAGLAAILIYAFGPIPFYLATAGELAPGTGVAVNGLFVVFASAGLATIILSLTYRQPLAMGWSLPGLIYMATVAPGHSLGEIVGANVAASLVLAILAITGLAGRLTRAIPLPVVMGMLAGTTLAYCTGAASAAGAQPLIVGAPIAGYFGARLLRRTWLPPVAGAMAVALPLLFVTGDLAGIRATPGVPGLDPIAPAFRLGPMAAIAGPLVIISLVGNAQGLALLETYGYRPSYRAVTAMTAAMSLVHAFFAAPPASMQRASLATMANDDAGPASTRWVAAVIASLGAIALAFTAISQAAFTGALPPEFIHALIGLIMLTVTLEALRKSVGSAVPMAGFIAFVVAASDLNAGGLGAATWAIVAGVVAHLLLQREAGRG